MENLRAAVAKRIAEAEDEELDVEEEMRALEERRLAVQTRRLEILSRKRRLRKEANLLSSRESEMFAREFESIEEMEKLEEEAAQASQVVPPTGSSEPSVPCGPDLSASESALSPFPSEWLEMEIPPDWSFAQYLHTGGTASGA